MTGEPVLADPEDVARKRAAAPTLKIPPPPTYAAIGTDGKLVDYKPQPLGLRRKARNRIGELLYNMFITHIPSHTIRLGFLRLFGATIGEGSAIMRTTLVHEIEFLTIGKCSTVGGRCLLDARAGLCIGDNVTIASDVHFLAGQHDINHPDFVSVPVPTVIQDYAWIASRAMVLPVIVGRGAVVGAQALVVKDVGECEVVGGNPAKVISKRNPDALRYSASYRPLFY